MPTTPHRSLKLYWRVTLERTWKVVANTFSQDQKDVWLMRKKDKVHYFLETPSITARHSVDCYVRVHGSLWWTSGRVVPPAGEKAAPHSCCFAQGQTSRYPLFQTSQHFSSNKDVKSFWNNFCHKKKGCFFHNAVFAWGVDNRFKQESRQEGARETSEVEDKHQHLCAFKF